MDLLIFVDINSSIVDEKERWSDVQINAVYKGFCDYYQQTTGMINEDLKGFVVERCCGRVFESLFEYHTGDEREGKKTLDEVEKQSKLFFEVLKNACADVDLRLSYHSAV